MKSEVCIVAQAHRAQAAGAAVAKRLLRNRRIETLKMLLGMAVFILHSSFFVSCSESEEGETEYANWQSRNDAFFNSLEDSLAADPASWEKIKSYTKDQSLTTGKNTDCIYVKKLSPVTSLVKGDSSTSPVSTDSVLVSYVGHLIPSASYPDGFIFDTRAYKENDPMTSSTERFYASSPLIDGFCTALYHMQRGDHWLVYIPYTLAYGSTKSETIPAYSTLIFNLTLIDFAPIGQSLPVLLAPRKQ